MFVHLLGEDPLEPEIQGVLHDETVLLLRDPAAEAGGYYGPQGFGEMRGASGPATG